MTEFNDDNIRIITKFSLYEDPDLKDEELVQTTSAYHSYSNYEDESVPHTAGCDWTEKNWLKSGMQSSHKMPKLVKTNLSKGQKAMLKAFNTPVKMNKAESMMRKMGWNGGPLGKKSGGIVTPIVPNIAYASSTIGFGQVTTDTQKKGRKLKPSSKVVLKRERRKVFKTNVLHTLLEFINNVSELEIAFDGKLSKHERKMIHNLVNDLFEDDVSLKNYDSNAYLDLVRDVKNNCIYLLGTQSVGKDPNRQLHIYKEAPDHIYLVTPDDLVPEINKDDKPEVIPKPKIKEKVNKCNEFNIFKRPIGQPSLGELIAKTYKESEDSEPPTHELNAKLRVEGIESDISISSGEISAELNSENNDCETSISTSVSSKLNLENEYAKTIHADGKSSELNLKTKDFVEANVVEKETKQEEVKEVETVNAELDSQNNESIKEVSEENCDKCDIPFPMRKLIDYFLDFSEDEYKEMRFLGPFDAEQNDFINSFVENIQWCIRKSDNAKMLFEYRTDDVYKAMTSESCRFEINEDNNGVV